MIKVLDVLEIEPVKWGKVSRSQSCMHIMPQPYRGYDTMKNENHPKLASTVEGRLRCNSRDRNCQDIIEPSFRGHWIFWFTETPIV